jgi:catechol 2,3-dioxygenase-like lactoylglutathione lyase family enzyme
MCAMLITGLFHCAIRTADLPRTRAFYLGVLGMVDVPRPASIKFDGAWFALPTPTKDVIVHVYAGDVAKGTDGTIAPHNEQGVVDHLSVSAHGFLDFRARFQKMGLSHREQNNGSTNWQMFVHDPNGLKIELTFEQTGEQGLPVDIPPALKYKAAERFFNPSEYDNLPRG